MILMYLNPFLAKLPDEAREGLCQRMRLETINRDQTIYKQGEELQSFFLILSGEFSQFSSVDLHLVLSGHPAAPTVCVWTVVCVLRH